MKQIFVLTPWNKAALEKLTVAQLTTDFPQKFTNATTFFSHRNPGKMKLHSLMFTAHSRHRPQFCCLHGCEGLVSCFYCGSQVDVQHSLCMPGRCMGELRFSSTLS